MPRQLTVAHHVPTPRWSRTPYRSTAQAGSNISRPRITATPGSGADGVGDAVIKASSGVHRSNLRVACMDQSLEWRVSIKASSGVTNCFRSLKALGSGADCGLEAAAVRPPPPPPPPPPSGRCRRRRQAAAAPPLPPVPQRPRVEPTLRPGPAADSDGSPSRAGLDRRRCGMGGVGGEGDGWDVASAPGSVPTLS
jgi:hypothetical protein